MDWETIAITVVKGIFKTITSISESTASTFEITVLAVLEIVVPYGLVVRIAILIAAFGDISSSFPPIIGAYSNCLRPADRNIFAVDTEARTSSITGDDCVGFSELPESSGGSPVGVSLSRVGVRF